MAAWFLAHGRCKYMRKICIFAYGFTFMYTCVYIFIQYMARIWPKYSLCDLHIHMHWVFLIWYPYALVFLYGNTAHCSGYGVAMGCYGLFIFPRTAIVTSQWYDRYCFTEYARTWARHPTTPWQRECTAITDCQSINSMYDSMRFVAYFREITPYIYIYIYIHRGTQL